MSAQSPDHKPAGADSATTLIILGVDHSAQLVGRSYHAGYLRAFLDRVHPAAICIERSPDEFARNDFYEFTYEQQYVVVPFARERHVALCLADWLPSRDDERLAFGRLNVVEAPLVLGPKGFQGFFVADSEMLHRTLFYADSAADRAASAAFFDQARAPGGRDFPRRLVLYRTFMQAMRVRAATRAYPGKTVVLVIGSMHKDDIERTLGDDPMIHIVQPSTYALPTPAAAEDDLNRMDRFAIVSFNVLGVQSLLGPVDWPWVAEMLTSLERSEGSTPELSLLKTRFDLLTHRISAKQAAQIYERLVSSSPPTLKFTFTGVQDARRVDSYFDPFGNLGIRDRAIVEWAREAASLGDRSRVTSLHSQLLGAHSWSSLQLAELDVYWDRYIAAAH